MPVEHSVAKKFSVSDFDPATLTVVDVVTKEWWDRTYGNTYFATRVTLTDSNFGTKTLCLPIQYGYDHHSFAESLKLLRELGYVDDDKAFTFSHEATSGGRRIHYRESKSDGHKKRDVKDWGLPD